MSELELAAVAPNKALAAMVGVNDVNRDRSCSSEVDLDCKIAILHGPGNEKIQVPDIPVDKSEGPFD